MLIIARQGEVRKSLFRGSRQFTVLFLLLFHDGYLDLERFGAPFAEKGLHDSKGLEQCKDADIAGFLGKGQSYFKIFIFLIQNKNLKIFFLMLKLKKKKKKKIQQKKHQNEGLKILSCLQMDKFLAR